MAIKLTLSELKTYIFTESKKLYKLAILKEKIIKNLSESSNQDYTSTQFYSAEELKKIRHDLIKKAAGWAFQQDTDILSEIDKTAMQAAKDDIQKSGGVFKPLGQSEFEKHLDKKSLKKVMSPERMGENEIPTNQALKLTNKTIETVKSWIAADGSRKASNKIIDFFLNKWLGLTSSDFPDNVTFANGLDEIEEMLNVENYVEAFLIAKNTAREMINEIQEF
jgi:hypothetical protein